jgi:HSP20 family protein
MTQKGKKEGNGSRMPSSAMEKTGRHGETGETSRHPLTRLRDEVSTLFDRFFGSWSMPWEWGMGSDRFWGVEVLDEDKDIVVRAEAPGFEPKDFDIHISDNTLSMRAEHKQEQEHKEGEMRTFERKRSSFQRLIPLPSNVDPDKVEAHYKNGVLEVRLQKTEDAQRRRIEVKS